MSAALLLGLLALARGVSQIKRAGEEVAVTGSARRAIRSDFAIWRISVVVQSPSVSAASEGLAKGTEQVTAFLRAQGMVDSQVTVKPMEAYPVPELSQDGRETGRISATRLSQVVELRSSDVDAVTRLSQRIGSLIASGVPITPQAPEYLYTKLGEIRTSLLEEATKDAKTRAEAIVRSTGGSVGGVREARMGVFQITPRMSTEVADYGINDVSSVEKDVTAVVRVSFSIR